MSKNLYLLLYCFLALYSLFILVVNTYALVNAAAFKVLYKQSMNLKILLICSFCVPFCCACWPYTSVWPCRWVVIAWMSLSVHTDFRTTIANWWSYPATSTSAALQAGATCKWTWFFTIWTISRNFYEWLS